VWYILGVVGAIICLERFYAACKKVYLKRAGRDTTGFAQLPVITTDDVTRDPGEVPMGSINGGSSRRGDYRLNGSDSEEDLKDLDNLDL